MSGFLAKPLQLGLIFTVFAMTSWTAFDATSRLVPVSMITVQPPPPHTSVLPTLSDLRLSIQLPKGFCSTLCHDMAPLKKRVSVPPTAMAPPFFPGGPPIQNDTMFFFNEPFDLAFLNTLKFKPLM